jgi:hypothetical protein
MKENKSVKVLISFTRGMYRFSDIVNKAAELGVLKKDAQSYRFPPDFAKEASIKMKEVRMHTSQYFKGELFETLRDAIKADFGFGIEDGKFGFFDDMEEGEYDVDADEEAVDALLDDFNAETAVRDLDATDSDESEAG